MDRPHIYCEGEGSREVYYISLTTELALKISWRGEESFVRDIPTTRQAADIPKPVAEKLKLAHDLARRLEGTITRQEEELGRLRERELSLLGQLEQSRKKTGGTSGFLRRFSMKGA